MGAVELNGDCFLVLTPPAQTRAAREAACGTDGYPALLHWDAALQAMGSDGYIGLYQNSSGASSPEIGWAWHWPGGDPFPAIPKSAQDVHSWLTGNPEDFGGGSGEDGSEDYAALEQGYLIDLPVTHPISTVVCQWDGLRNLSYATLGTISAYLSFPTRFNGRESLQIGA